MALRPVLIADAGVVEDGVAEMRPPLVGDEADLDLVKPVEFAALVDLVRTLRLYWVVMSEPPDVRT